MRFLKGYFNTGWEEESNHNVSENIQEDNALTQTETTYDLTHHAKQLSKGLLVFGAGVLGYVGLNVFGGAGRGDKASRVVSDVDNYFVPLSDNNPVDLSAEFSSTSKEMLSSQNYQSPKDFALILPSTSKTLLNIQQEKEKEGGLELSYQERKTPQISPARTTDRFSSRRAIITTEQSCEFQVNSYITSIQTIPSVASLTNDGFVVVWYSSGQDGDSSGVYGQRYDASAGREGSEFQVNTYTTDSQSSLSVASLTNGGFVVVWGSYDQDGDAYGVYGQRYNATGGREDSEFQVNTYTTGWQHFSSVTGLTNGGFVVVWKSPDQDGDLYGVYGQRYNTTGGREGSEFQVNTYTTNSQSSPSVASLPNGGFVVVWSSIGQDGDLEGVYGQRYNATGSREGNEFQVNTYTTNNQHDPLVASLIDGAFVVTWRSDGQDGDSYGVYGQLYNASASRVGVEFQVSTYTPNKQQYPSVASLPNGGFVVVWQSTAQDGDSNGVYGQRYNATGGREYSEFQVNTYTASDQEYPSVIGLPNGGFVVMWGSNGQDGDNYGVFGRISAPCLVKNMLTVNEGETVFLNTTFLDATTIGAPDSLLNFTVANVQQGFFDKLSSPGTPLSTFTKEEMINAQIRFVHDDSEIAPSYDIKVSDGIYETSYQAAVITFVNINDQPPLLINNQLTVSQDGRVSLDYTMLKATDPDTDDAGLIFIVDNIQHGFFEETDQGKTITNFTQQEITDKKIWFFHDGTSQPPSYRVKASDGELETSYQSAEIVFERTKANVNSDWLVPVLVASGAAGGGVVVFGVAGCVCLIAIGGICLSKANKNKLNHRMSMREVEMAAINGPLKISPLMQKFIVKESEITFVKMIGQGGEAVVYEAKWSNKTVAYKVTPILDNGAITEFEKEAKIMLESNHPRIVSVYRICLLSCPQRIGLVMEFMKLGSLKEAIANSDFELTWESKWNIAYDLASVISFLHEQDTVHRDIKPDNLLLCREEGELHVKLADFGLSKMRRDAKVSVTMGLGTYKYMAPEMVLGDGHYSEEATDIYAVGMTLVSLVNREEPYPDLGNAMNVPANVGAGKLWQTLSKDNCSPAFFKLVNKCRDVDANDRPMAEQIVRKLEEIKAEVVNFEEHREEDIEVNEELSSQELMANMSV